MTTAGGEQNGKKNWCKYAAIYVDSNACKKV